MICSGKEVMGKHNGEGQDISHPFYGRRIRPSGRVCRKRCRDPHEKDKGKKYLCLHQEVYLFFRQASMGAEKRIKELSYQVRKIGVNINQAVTKINSGYGGPSDIRMLQQCLADVENRVKRVEMQIEKNYGDNETHAHQFG